MSPAEPRLPGNRTFGLFFSAVFGLAGLYALYLGAGPYARAAFAVAVLLLCIALIKAEWLLPLNRLWLRFGLLLGRIVSPIVLGAIFFGLFTPLALLMRLFGRDELRLKLRPDQSLWQPRDTPASGPCVFTRQF